MSIPVLTYELTLLGRHFHGRLVEADVHDASNRVLCVTLRRVLSSLWHFLHLVRLALQIYLHDHGLAARVLLLLLM